MTFETRHAKLSNFGFDTYFRTVEKIGKMDEERVEEFEFYEDLNFPEGKFMLKIFPMEVPLNYLFGGWEISVY